MIYSKERIITLMRGSIQSVIRYIDLSDYLLRIPMEVDKWSIFETIGHLTAWDQFILKKRLPHLIQGIPVSPIYNIDVHIEKYMKDICQIPTYEILRYFIQVRKMLITQIMQMSDKSWCRVVKIGQKEQTMAQYFQQLIEHDEKHFRQIDRYLEKH